MIGKMPSIKIAACLALSTISLALFACSSSSNSPQMCPTASGPSCSTYSATPGFGLVQTYATECDARCAPNAAYCSSNVGFTTIVPDGCTSLGYSCVPVGSAGADCTVYFCCPGSGLDGGS
jgi:hypothetical protein